MTLEFSCQICGRQLRVNDSFAGKLGKCPGCGEEVRVPEHDAPPPSGNAWLEALSEDEDEREPTGPTLPASSGRSRRRSRRSSEGQSKTAVLAGAIAGGVVVIVVALFLVLRRGEQPAVQPPDSTVVADRNRTPSPTPKTTTAMADLASYLTAEMTSAFGFRPSGNRGQSNALLEPLWLFAGAALERAGIARPQVAEVICARDAKGKHLLLAARTSQSFSVGSIREALGTRGSIEQVEGAVLVSLPPEDGDSSPQTIALCEDGRTLLLGNDASVRAAVLQTPGGGRSILNPIARQRNTSVFWAVSEPVAPVGQLFQPLLPPKIRIKESTQVSARQVRSAAMTVRFQPNLRLELHFSTNNDDRTAEIARVVEQVIERIINPEVAEEEASGTDQRPKANRQAGSNRQRAKKRSPGIEIKREGTSARITWTVSPTSLAGRFAQRFAATLALRSMMQTAEGSALMPGPLRSTKRVVLDLAHGSEGMPRGALAQEEAALIQQISWMAKLLPYLGYRDVYERIQFAEPWYEHDNASVASTLIPAFLNPNANEFRWKGYPFDGVALSHFVGMAGLGADAPNLPRDDPRAGIFGYERSLRPDEIKDGAASTIMMISAGEIYGPWMQAGGSTVRGARPPYFEGLSGFQTPGKRGGVAAFADGSVRFLSRDIDPRVFGALCTANGGEPAPEFLRDSTSRIGRNR